ncbi:MAG: right-handed parallel beta-helix repeat-containing protein, partial [Dehalococcoidales bacterium]|nr:right-handed parallel beta-helix repeat-containing protein [Dehalococcoidales bacterium]
TISNNIITGGEVGIALMEGANTNTISGNTITGTTVAGILGSLSRWPEDWESLTLACTNDDDHFNYLQITGNTISGNTLSNCGHGIAMEYADDNTLTTNTIENNTSVADIAFHGVSFTADAAGVYFDANSEGNVAHYNNISGNTGYGLKNANAGTTLDAEYNWWGSAAGPYHATNPGDTDYMGDAVSDDVNYRPWLYLTTAANGGDTVANIVANEVPAYAQSVVLDDSWNTFSVPIGLDGQYNTWKELYDLTNLDYSVAYRFDPDSQTFVALATTSEYAIAPGEGFYIKMNSDGSLPYCYSTQFSMPSRDLKAGWDMIGGGLDERSEVDSCISIATTGSTAGYTHIISPAQNADGSWVYIAGAESAHSFLPGEGYWVFMAGDRTLGLFDPTPVEWVEP